MAATIARAIGSDKGGRQKEVTRLGSESAYAEAATWKTFAYASVQADGSGYVRVERENGHGGYEQIHEFYFGPENETQALLDAATPLDSEPSTF